MITALVMISTTTTASDVTEEPSTDVTSFTGTAIEPTVGTIEHIDAIVRACLWLIGT